MSTTTSVYHANISVTKGQIAELKMAENEFETITEEMSTKSTWPIIVGKPYLNRLAAQRTCLSSGQPLHTGKSARVFPEQ